jgi:DNA-nicking Smr family endonuclease
MTRKLTDEEKELWRKAEKDGFRFSGLDVREEKARNPKTEPRKSIDARLDLHGLTIEKAHKKFLEFLYNAVIDEQKKLLIITGKGPEGKGKIKEELPKWCDTDYLAPFVSSCKIAPAEMGGNGAYIIKLKN